MNILYHISRGVSLKSYGIIPGMRKKRKTKTTKMKLGFSPTQATASGAGTHGGSPKRKNRKDRRDTKRRLRGL
jgi:hypothetical protein